MRSALFGIGLFAFLSVSPASASSIYAINYSNGPDSIVGSITTDGTVLPSLLDDSTIIAWDITITGGSPTSLSTHLTDANSSLDDNLPGALSANTSTLFYDFSAPGQFFRIVSNDATAPSFLGLFSVDGSTAPFVELKIFPTNDAAIVDDIISVDQRNIPISVETTPLPAALPLFTTGLGALGLLGWRRRRKASALAS